MRIKKEKRSKKERTGGPWKLTALMEIRPQHGFPQRLEKDLAKNARLFHSSHRPDGGYRHITFSRQRSTLRSPFFCLNNGEHFHTPCIGVRLANNTVIILDCGTGLRTLGKSMLREFTGQPIRAYIFLTHFHWDHIQGIPFFSPFYAPGNYFFFHSAGRRATEIEAALYDQMVNPYFPVDMRAMRSVRHFFDLDEHPINLLGAIISSAQMNHPQGCVGYRIEADGGVFVLATDTEPGSPPHDKAIRELARNADVLVYDAQFTPEQVSGGRKGWGHSSWLEGSRIAQEYGVKRLILFHHDPNHDDTLVDKLVDNARSEFKETYAAIEGLQVTLPSGFLAMLSSPGRPDQRGESRYTLEIPADEEWRTPKGEVARRRGMVRNLSQSGVYFVAPLETPVVEAMTVSAVLPSEITHRGDTVLQYQVQPVRRDVLSGGLGKHKPCVGIGGRIMPRVGL